MFEPKRIWIAKRAAPQNLVFGWASIAVAKSTGKQFADVHSRKNGIGHKMNPDALEESVYEFLEEMGGIDSGGIHHEGDVSSLLVESFVVTPEKLEALGLAPNALPIGWFTGWRVTPETFARVESGELAMLSVEGTADTIPA